MSLITSHAAVAHFPSPPLKITVTANQWRVVQLDRRAAAVGLWCKAAMVYGVRFFNSPGVDGPTDGAVSNSGSYQLADTRTFQGATGTDAMQQPTISLGADGRAKPGYMAVTSTSNGDVSAELFGAVL